MAICKRYRLVTKILEHIIKPWKGIKVETLPTSTVQNILRYRFDQIFEPDSEADNQIGGIGGLGGPSDVLMASMQAKQLEAMDSSNLVQLKHNLKKEVPPEILQAAQMEEEQFLANQKTKEEESTFILQMEIIRSLHGKLNKITDDANHLFGFQIFIHLICTTILLVVFGYCFSFLTTEGSQVHYAFCVMLVVAFIKTFFLGYWGHRVVNQSKQPFLTLCKISTLEGTPKLERQVQKMLIQLDSQSTRLTASEYFVVDKNLVLKIVAVASFLCFMLINFNGHM